MASITSENMAEFIFDMMEFKNDSEKLAYVKSTICELLKNVEYLDISSIQFTYFKGTIRNKLSSLEQAL